MSNQFKKAGIDFLVAESGTNGAIMVIPAYGRIIGLWSDVSSKNHLWTDLSFLDCSKKVDTYGQRAWVNLGGDRMWLSPEREFFIRDLVDPWNTYSVPSCIDPGNYRCDAKDNAISLTTSGVAQAFASRCAVDFSIIRRITPLSDVELGPIAGECNLHIAGYEKKTILDVDRECPIRMSLWNLLQVRSGGKMFLSTKGKADYTTFFGEFAATPLYRRDCFAVCLDSPQIFKIGLQSSHLNGKVGYIEKAENGEAMCLVQIFEIHPDADYTDTPWDTPAEPGSAFELFGGGTKHGYAELETHGPAIGGISPEHCCAETSRLYACSGPQELVWSFMERELNLPGAI